MIRGREGDPVSTSIRSLSWGHLRGGPFFLECANSASAEESPASEWEGAIMTLDCRVLIKLAGWQPTG